MTQKSKAAWKDLGIVGRNVVLQRLYELLEENKEELVTLQSSEMGMPINYAKIDIEDGISLSGDIALKALKTGMLSSLTEAQIKEKIKIFLTPEETKAHGQLIDRDKAETCGLTVEKVIIDSMTWKLSYELFVRLNHFVSNQVSKCIESGQHFYMTGVDRTNG